jgi:hypothetical protein
MASPRYALFLAAALGLAGPAHAAWPTDPFLNLPLCTAAGAQANLVSCSDGAGGAIVAWQDPRTGGADIYAARVRSVGVAAWTTDGVLVCGAAGAQGDPQIVSDGAGGCLIVWEDSRNGPGETDIYIQRLDSLGVAQWDPNGVVVSDAASVQQNPALTGDGTGGAVVVWDDRRAGSPDIYVQRVNAAGVIQWGTDAVDLCTASIDQINPQIASDGAGGAIAVWQDLRSGTHDVYARRVNAAGVPQWTPDGVALCTATGNQTLPMIVADGAGGAVAAWTDGRTPATDVYAQRINGVGVPQWTPDGVGVCTAAQGQTAVRLIPDGLGGAFVTWDDFRDAANRDVYVQRVGAGGVPAWTANGVAIGNAGGSQSAPHIVSDGLGGAVIAWVDARTGQQDAYAQRVSGSGVAAWDPGGVAISVAAGSQSALSAVADGTGGAVLAWIDTRSGVADIWCQRFDRHGRLGLAEPLIASVRDIPNDQGSRVKLAWLASYLDLEPTAAIADYWLFRSVPPNVVAEARAAGAVVLRAGEAVPGTGRWFEIEVLGAATIFWEYLATVPASHDAGYSFVASTTGDSLPGSNPMTLFRVRARTANGVQYWDSPPDSGYSVDNLGPASPAPFTGAYQAGATHLHWGANSEADLAGYRLHRGTSPGFVPGPGNLIASPSDTGYVDAGPAGSYYKLAAMDVLGNTSPFALLGPSGTVGVPEIGAGPIALAAPRPNPAGEAGTWIAFALPRATFVELAAFDISGRRVALLARGERPAGDHQLRWDGRDDAGRPLESGLYWIALDAESGRFCRRVAIAR